MCEILLPTTLIIVYNHLMSNICKKNRIIALVVLIVLLTSCLKAPALPQMIPLPQAPSPLPEANVQITMMLKTDDYVMEDWPVMDQLFRQSGISALIKTIRPSRYIETLNVNLSSGKIYDVMELPPAYVHAASEYIINAAPIINQYGPNYINWLTKFSDDMLIALSSSTGEILLFPIRQQVGVVSAIPFIKKEVDGRNFDAVSFYNAISQSGGKFAVPGSTMTLCELVAPLFATSTSVLIENEKQVFGPTTAKFKAMLLYLNSLYNKGMLSESFFVYTPTNLLYDIKSGVVTAGIFEQKYYEEAFNAGMEPFMFNPVDGASLPGYYNMPISYAALSNANGKESYAMQFIDYCFSDEGRRLLNNGIESLHMAEYDNGVITPIAPFSHAGSFQWKEQGLTPEGMPGLYYTSWTQFEKPLYDMLVPMREYGAGEDLLVAPLPVLGTNALAAQVVTGAIDPILNEWWSEFIVGSKSLSSDWDEYIRDINSAGLSIYMDLHYN